jgi:hypothetical protein
MPDEPPVVHRLEAMEAALRALSRIVEKLENRLERVEAGKVSFQCSSQSGDE